MRCHVEGKKQGTRYIIAKLGETKAFITKGKVAKGGSVEAGRDVAHWTRGDEGGNKEGKLETANLG